MKIPLCILAGGLATRMRPLTESVPKSMLMVEGYPFIHWQLESVKRSGIDEVVLCLGHLANQIINFVGNGEKYGLKINYSLDDKKFSNTGGALLKAIRKFNTPFFVTYGDSFFEIPASNLYQYSNINNFKNIITVFNNHGNFDSSNLEFRHPRVIKYSKNEDRNDSFKYIDYGFSMFDPDTVRDFYCESKPTLSHIMERMVEEKILFGYEVFDRFYEIGSKKGLSDFQNLIKQGNSYVQ